MACLIKCFLLLALCSACLVDAAKKMRERNRVGKEQEDTSWNEIQQTFLAAKLFPIFNVVQFEVSVNLDLFRCCHMAITESSLHDYE